MAKVTFEEVRLMNEGKPISPQVMSGSVKNLDGTPYTNHNHDDRYYTETEIDDKLSGKSDTSHTHDDRYYTETEIDNKLSGYYTKTESDNAFTRLPKVYTLSDSLSRGYTLQLDDMNLGDIAFITGATFEAKGSLAVMDGTGHSERVYLMYVKDSNFPDSEIENFSMVTGKSLLYYISKEYASSYTIVLNLFIMRIK